VKSSDRGRGDRI